MWPVPASSQPWLICAIAVLFHEYVWLLAWKAAGTKVRIGIEALLIIVSMFGIAALPKLTFVPAAWVAPLTLTCLLLAVSGVLMAVFLVISPDTSIALWVVKSVLFAGMWYFAPSWLSAPAEMNLNHIWVALLLAGPYSIPLVVGIVVGLIVLAISLVLVIIVSLFRLVYGLGRAIVLAPIRLIKGIANSARGTVQAYQTYSKSVQHDIINKSLETGVRVGSFSWLLENNFTVPHDLWHGNDYSHDLHGLHPEIGLVAVIAAAIVFVWRTHARPESRLKSMSHHSQLYRRPDLTSQP